MSAIISDSNNAYHARDKAQSEMMALRQQVFILCILLDIVPKVAIDAQGNYSISGAKYQVYRIERLAIASTTLETRLRAK